MTPQEVPIAVEHIIVARNTMLPFPVNGGAKKGAWRLGLGKTEREQTAIKNYSRKNVTHSACVPAPVYVAHTKQYRYTSNIDRSWHRTWFNA